MTLPRVIEVPVGPFGESLLISGHPARNGIPALYLFRLKRGDEEQLIKTLSQEQAEAFQDGLGATLGYVASFAERQPPGQGRFALGGG